MLQGEEMTQQEVMIHGIVTSYFFAKIPVCFVEGLWCKA